MNRLPENPYVGPRSFRREEASKFFGRENEARDLLSLVISEQLVLFYAQSGAGKSSLINTSLIPSLEERKFEVLPVGRVSSAFMETGSVDNIYIFNLLLSLDQSKRDPRRFAHIKLTDFLNKLTRNGQQFYYDDRSNESTLGVDSSSIEVLPRALIIDQFEEIITTYPEAWQKREDFFRQLAEAMRADPYLWVVLVMREDYVAALDPYAHLLPRQLRARYYMQRMGVQAALEAIGRPVEKIRPFEPGVPELLVDNMRLISNIKPAGHGDQLLYGEFIEPVQLQVVCYQLWERVQKIHPLTKSVPTINRNDLLAIAKGESITQFISNALADFYEQAIAKVLTDPAAKVDEQDLRDWFTHKLITEAETRGFVYRGAENTAGLPNRAVDILASEYIIRSESKAGGVWIELVHDRFVGPILQANRKWSGQHQKSVLTDATAWKNAGKPDDHLYDGKQLESLLAELETYPDRFATIEKDFIRASQRAASRRRRQLQSIFGTAIFVVFLLLAGSLVAYINSAQQAAAFANQAATEAANAKTEASNARNESNRLLTQSANSINLIVQANSADALQTVVATQEVQIGTLQAMVFTIVTPTLEGAIIVPSPSPLATTTPGPIGEQVIGQSRGGKEIRVYQYGNGPRHVVLVGGLHAGFAPSTVQIAQRLKDYLSNNLDLIPPSITVDLIITANPDSLPPPGRDVSGLLEGRLNALQVDLNRNWDCDWKEDALWRNGIISGGKTPFSEPETVALRDFIKVNKLTVAVVFWEARDNPPSVSPGGCGEVSVYSDPLSRIYADAAGYRAQDFAAYAVNGDATNWLDSQGIGAVTVLLPSYTELRTEDFEANLNGVKQILQIYGR